MSHAHYLQHQTNQNENSTNHTNYQNHNNNHNNSRNNSHNNSRNSHNNSHSNHSHRHSHRHNHRHRSIRTRVFATGYNYNYQFGLDCNDNYSSDVIELKWCRGLNISYICSGLTHLIYLSFTGNYYFCGQIDTEKLGIVSDINKNINLLNPCIENKNGIITKSVATPIDIFLSNNNNNIIRVSRMADGVSARHIIIISKDFKSYSMGNNERGQLGLGHFKSTLNFEEINFKLSDEDILNYISFDCIDASCGESHSAFVLMPKCILPIKKILYYWFHLCNLIKDKKIYNLISKYIISSSSLLTDPRGRLYVCGCNNFGQLGIGNNSSTQVINNPIRVIGGGLCNVSIAQVSCGENHTVCLDNRGRVYCFGDNYYGQSGAHINHYENVYYPIKIEHFKKQYQARIVKVSSGKYHCVALDKLGRVFCWGLGAYGQLGCNKLNKRIILPIYVDSLYELYQEKVCDVRCGVYHTAALTQSGKLFCWGSNNYGQCFQNTNQENIPTPTLAKLDFLKNSNLIIYKIFCGYYSTLILTRDKH